MIDYREDTEWKVYAHIAPNGKMYVGITKRSPQKRWINGMGYKNNLHFSRSIKKFGWENFQHEIIAENLTRKEAENFEIGLIEGLELYKPEYGYNISHGGGGGYGTGIPVCQFTLEGDFVSEFCNAVEASASTKVSACSIGNVCRNKTLIAGGFAWSFSKNCEDKAEFKKIILEQVKRKNAQKAAQIERIRECSNRPVYQLNDDYEIVNEFRSIKEASEFLGKSSQSGVSKGCREHEKEYGYYWIFKKDYQSLLNGDFDFCKRKAHRRSVSQFTLDGDFIQSFESTREAARSVNGGANGIWGACSGEKKSYQGFLWKFTDEYSGGKIQPYSSEKAKSVIQFDTNGKYLAEYSGTPEAFQKTGVSKSAICASIRENRIAGNYRWKYKQDCILDENGNYSIA